MVVNDNIVIVMPFPFAHVTEAVGEAKQHDQTPDSSNCTSTAIPIVVES